MTMDDEDLRECLIVEVEKGLGGLAPEDRKAFDATLLNLLKMPSCRKRALETLRELLVARARR